jgi:thiol:disulfide interchange protein DsbC
MRIAGIAARAALVSVAVAYMTPLHADDTAVRSHIKQTLEQRFPTVKVDAVQPAPLPGVYEVIAGEHVGYTDANADYLILGRLMDTRTREDLSEAHLDAYNSIDFHALPFDKAIKIVKGNGERQLAVFADPDCPYCRQLEKDLRTVTDITVYVFLFPLEAVHQNATAHAHAIWCATDRAATWTDWVLDRKAPAAQAGKCDGDPIGELQTLGASLRVHATPTLFLQNGQRIGGYIPLERLQKLMAQAARVPAAPAVAAQRDGREESSSRDKPAL